MSYTNIAPQQLHELCLSGQAIDLIDVRSPLEYAVVHADGATLIPLDTLTPEAVRAVRRGPETQPLYVICHSGGRSRKACERLAAAGMNNLVNVEGGTTAWAKANLPVVRGKPPILRTLARPIGISLTLLFLALAVTVKIYFLLAIPVVWASMIAVGGCPSCSTPIKASCPART